MTHQSEASPQLRPHAERLGTAQDYRLLVESATDYAILILDPQDHVVTWNEGARRLKGYDAADVIGQHFSIFYPKDDLPLCPVHCVSPRANRSRRPAADHPWRRPTLSPTP